MILLAGGTPCQADEDRLVTVCAACLCASCWQGKFYCQEARTADIVRKPIRELRALEREHESYWTVDADRGEA